MSRDLRQYARQTNLCLLIGGLLILYLVGDGLIYFFYGSQAALSGLLCLCLGLAPLLLIGVCLWAMEWIVKRSDPG